MIDDENMIDDEDEYWKRSYIVHIVLKKSSQISVLRDQLSPEFEYTKPNNY